MGKVYKNWEKQVEAQTEAFEAGFRKRAKKLKDKINEQGTKRKTYKELIKVCKGIRINLDKAVRTPESWVSKSFNFDKQLIDFIKHLFAKYPIPPYLIKTINYKGTFVWEGTLLFEDVYIDPTTGTRSYTDWAIAVGAGKSFAKVVKNIMSKKEAHYFLNYKGSLTVIPEIIWWAKVRANTDITGKLANLIATKQNGIDFESKKWNDVIVFFGRYKDLLNSQIVTELYDYLLSQPEDFSLQHRTLTSVIRLSNEWHHNLHIQRSFHKKPFVTWEPLFDSPWKVSYKRKTKSGVEYVQRYTISEITNSRSLYNEGRRQGHCVSSYVDNCMSGKTHIFTLEVQDSLNPMPRKLITIEVDNFDRVLQKRGKYNRMPEKIENKIIKKWAVVKRLSTVHNW